MTTSLNAKTIQQLNNCSKSMYFKNINGKYFDFNFKSSTSETWRTRNGVYSMKLEKSPFYSVWAKCLFFGKPLYMYTLRKDLKDHILVQFIVDSTVSEIHEISDKFIEELNENEALKKTLDKKRKTVVEIKNQRYHEELGFEYDKNEHIFRHIYTHSDHYNKM
jgi:hypothetical protein